MATDTDTSTTSEETTTETGDAGASTDTGASTETETETGDEDPDEGDAAKWKALARKHERESKKKSADLDKITKANQTDADKAIEKARQEGRDEASAAALTSNVATILEVVATEKLADPSYVRLIDDDVREGFSDDGKVDRKAITKAVDALVRQHPELKKTGSAAALPGSKGSRSAAAGVDMNEEIRRRAGR